jgi:hypothetical protein
MPLGTWGQCQNCREYGYSGTHRCKPEWEACDADDMEWETVRGRDAEDAAESYCALRDPYNEYGTVTASRTVLIRPIGRDDLRRRYIVAGDLQPVYTATLRQLIGDE